MHLYARWWNGSNTVARIIIGSSFWADFHNSVDPWATQELCIDLHPQHPHAVGNLYITFESPKTLLLIAYCWWEALLSNKLDKQIFCICIICCILTIKLEEKKVFSNCHNSPKHFQIYLLIKLYIEVNLCSSNLLFKSNCIYICTLIFLKTDGLTSKKSSHTCPWHLLPTWFWPSFRLPLSAWQGIRVVRRRTVRMSSRKHCFLRLCVHFYQSGLIMRMARMCRPSGGCHTFKSSVSMTSEKKAVG